MKRLRKPTLQQKKLLFRTRRTVSDYLVMADYKNELWAIHKYSGRIHKIKKPQIIKERMCLMA